MRGVNGDASDFIKALAYSAATLKPTADTVAPTMPEVSLAAPNPSTSGVAAAN